MKLHLGCEKKFIEGFTHVDLLDFEHIDYKSSVDNLEFAKDSSVDLIYASHVLEHFGRHEPLRVLKEWNRVLKKGGILRVAVPDFEACVKRYVKEGNIKELTGLICGGQRDEYDFHKMIFDFKLLNELLLQAGFSKVYRYDWENTEHAHIDDYSQAYLPHMDKENGLLMSLNVEAVK